MNGPIRGKQYGPPVHHVTGKCRPRTLPDPVPGVPAGLKKARVKIGQPVDQGQTITGQVVYKPANSRPLPSETITVPSPGKHESPITFSPSQHTMRLLKGSESGSQKLREMSAASVVRSSMRTSGTMSSLITILRSIQHVWQNFHAFFCRRFRPGLCSMGHPTSCFAAESKEID